MIDTDFTIRLAKVLGRLGSDQPGEVANAARLADQMVRGTGATWADVIHAPSAARSRLSPQNTSTKANASDLLNRFRALLSASDVAFLTNVAGRVGPPTDRQQEIVDRIAARATSHRRTTR